MAIGRITLGWAWHGAQRVLLVPRLLGLLLVIAGLLKAHAVTTSPAPPPDFFSSRWLQVGWVEFELFFGAWLLTGWLIRQTRIAAMGLFGTFAGVSLAKALAGAPSCGCFGAVTVSPWLVVLGDSVAVALLWTIPAFTGQVKTGATLSRAALLLGCIGLVTITAGWVLTSRGAVAVSPESWIGKPFPLLNDMEIEADLSKGDWTIVLYRPECGKCAALLSDFTRSIDMGRHRARAAEIAFVDITLVDNFSEPNIEVPFGVRLGKLHSIHSRSIPTPLILRLCEGKVVAVEQTHVSSSFSI